MQSYKVTVGGHTFQIRSDASEEHITNLAKELSERYGKLTKKGPKAEQEFRAMAMVAMILLDELFETKFQRDSVKENATKFAENLVSKIDAILSRKDL